MGSWEDAYLKRLAELKLQHINHVVGGAVAGHDEYRHLTGTIQGLSIAEREFKEIVSGMTED
tara:strand:+ start:4619 stop:4804 length:186 start_codon:yes stop_codon:yes gene_type:complete